MKILDIAFKDLIRSFRSAFAIGMMVVAPLMLTGLIYFAFGSMSGGDVSMTAIKVGVVNADQLPSDSVLDAPIGNNIRSMFFDESVKSWIEAGDYANEASVRAAVDKQEIGVHIADRRRIGSSTHANPRGESRSGVVANVKIARSDSRVTSGWKKSCTWSSRRMAGESAMTAGRFLAAC